MPTLPHPLTGCGLLYLIEVQPDRPDTSGTTWTQARAPACKRFRTAQHRGVPVHRACSQPGPGGHYGTIRSARKSDGGASSIRHARASATHADRPDLRSGGCAANVICRAEQLRAVSALELSLGGVRSRRSRGDERAASRLDNYSPSPPSTMRASAAVSVPSLTAAGAPLAGNHLPSV